MAEVNISKDLYGRIVVSFYYDPNLVAKVKTIEGRRWHPAEKHWSFPNSGGNLEKILEVFDGEEIHLDPVVKVMLSSAKPTTPVIARHEVPKQSRKDHPASTFLGHNFEDLRRELVSRKYSFKTIKGYTFYSRGLLNFTGKIPAEINDGDIKNYLTFLVEKKNAATSTVNQAINALKFFYGTMLKKKFIYEVKRPRKDKKLPVVLSQEEVAKILTSLDNLKHKAILMLVYSAGLRVGEAVRLKPEDIDPALI